MAWEIAGYVLVFAAAVLSAVLTAGIVRLYRSLRRWDRMAIRLARKFETALDEIGRFAEEGRETAARCRETVDGFARLSEGARAVGDAAESVAAAAVHVTSFWRERSDGEFPDWAVMGRQLGNYLRRRFFGYSGEPQPSGPRRHGANADVDSSMGE